MLEVLLVAFGSLTAAASSPPSPPWDSVVRIEVAGVTPSYLRPWEKSAQHQSSGTGFLVDDGLILTNRHVVDNAVDIRISRTGNSKRWRARVVALGPDVDLAALELADDGDRADFFDGMVAVTWSDELPALQSRVTVRGYPMGGKSQSVTEGVVSRVEANNYRLGATAALNPGKSLVMQIDAAINGGNSGGPCFDSSNHVVGVAFQGINGAQSIGYIIPSSIARTFLSSARNTPQFKLVDVPFRVKHLENRGLRHFLKMNDKQTGVLVSAVSPLSSLAPPKNTSANASSDVSWLLPNDVITAIDDVSIGDDGTVALRPGERVHLDWLITSKLPGAPTKLDILRQGRPLTLHARLEPLVPSLPRWHGFDSQPEWVVIGGLLFSRLTAPLIEDAAESAGHGLAPSVHDTIQAEITAKNGFNADPNREVIVLLDLLNGGDVNHGYHGMGWQVLSTINGKPVRSLAELYATWQQSAAQGVEFLEFNFGDGSVSHRIILEQAAVLKSEEELLRMHGVPARASAAVVARSGIPNQKSMQADVHIEEELTQPYTGEDEQ